jgi:UDP-N-acetylmuramate dehydrogenase
MDMTEPNKIRMGTLRGRLMHGEPMRRHVSWRAGGNADRAYLPTDLEDLCAFMATVDRNEPVYFVGLGSNLLVRDGGLRGTVVFTHGALKNLLLEGETADAQVYAEAGVASPKVARFAAVHGLEGGEFLAGIPGTVGGALAMNAGCYGSETRDVVTRVRTIDREGRLWIRDRHEFSVGYRHVAPIEERAEHFVAAWFRFRRGNGQRARQTIKDLLAKRISSQPLSEPNAGSVFRNPAGDHASRLIESCGLKGRRIGGAEVSRKHANFIVNTGDASAADIEELIGLVRRTVSLETGVNLEPEVRIVGDAAPKWSQQ